MCLLTVNDVPHKLWIRRDTVIIRLYCVYEIQLLRLLLQTWRRYEMMRIFGTDLKEKQ